MAKTVAEYLSSDRTETQEQFLGWVYAETGVTFKTTAAREAFELGVRCGGLYSRFQAARREAPAPAPTAEKPVSKVAPKPAKRPAKTEAA